MLLPDTMEAARLLIAAVLNGEDTSWRGLYAEHRQEPSSGLPGMPFAPEASTSLDRFYSRMGVHLALEGTAVLPIYGALVKRLHNLGLSELGTSTEMLTNLFDEMRSDSRVRSVVLDVDSPGGMALGIEEAAEALYALSQEKPTIAVANEVMGSAAYYLGAQARQVRTTPTAIVGGIGTYAVRLDATGWAENEGYRVEVIKAGAYKADGHPFKPFTEEERSRWQMMVDTYYDQFVAAVARGRSITNSDALAFADGSTEIGAKAVSRGFADRVSTLRSTVADAEAEARVLFR